ncbi:MAG: ABC transporter substrate-binding protein [Bacteroidota bacterium]
MPLFEDQLKRKVRLDTFPPKRIVSLVPSITELLFDLGAADEIVGITRFCIHPENKVDAVKKIGGTKNVHIDRVMELQPDLIIGCKEENTRTDIEALATQAPVWISEVNTLDDATNLIHELGILLDRHVAAQSMLESIKNNFAKLKAVPRTKVAYMIWNNPMMVAANSTFINDMLCRIGFENVFASQTRYPTTTIEELQALNPEVVLLSSEPFPFKDEHVRLFSQALPNSTVLLVDGTYFSWYGSRLVQAPDYFNSVSSSLMPIVKA